MPKKQMGRVNRPRIDITRWGMTQEDRYKTYEKILQSAQATADKITAKWCSENPERFPCGWARVVFKAKEPYTEFLDWAIARNYISFDVVPQEHILMMEEQSRARRKDLESALLWCKKFASILRANSIECTVRDRID
jgi:hypothetical protein